MILNIDIEQVNNGYIINTDCKKKSSSFKIVCYDFDDMKKLVATIIDDHLTTPELTGKKKD